MATYSANDIIGKQLLATEQTVSFYDAPQSLSQFNFEPGESIGVVTSWVKGKDKKLYFQFAVDQDQSIYSNTKGHEYFYVKYDPSKMKMNEVDKASTVSEEEKSANIIDQRTKDTEGTIPYYLKKYGLPASILLLTFAAIKYHGNTTKSTKK